MKCSGQCYQGRSACTTPAACGLTPRKLNQANSDGSSSGSATAPMPISMEPDESDQDTDANLSMGDWALVFVALTAGIAAIAMLAGYALVKLA